MATQGGTVASTSTGRRVSTAHTPPTPPTADSATNAGPPKSRVKRACVACFTAKVRCSGEAPPCARCSRKSFQCWYDPAGNSRKSQRQRGSVTEETAGVADPASTWRVSPGPTTVGPLAGSDMEGSPPVAAAPPVQVRQPFFRWLGLTSVAPPGAPFRSLSVVVAERESPATGPGQSPTSPGVPQEPMIGTAQAEATVRTFYTLFENYLPYMPLSDTLDALARGTLSEVVLVGMTMLVKRMRPETPCPPAETLADRAKALAVAQLALPTLEVVYGLLLLAYHEHGADRDSGLWAYSGMAIRTAIDLGLHKPFPTTDQKEAALRSRIFWAVACLDRILSCGTGRLTTIPISQIDIDLPPPRETIRTAQGAALPDPFPVLCRLLLILGNVSDSVNANSATSTVPHVPQRIQLELAHFQASLPAPLQFSIHTFSAYVSAGCAPVFLLLSLWHQAVHLAIHQAALLYTQPGVASPEADGVTPQSGSSAISVGDMLAYSGLISNDAFLCTPTLSQPIMMAGRAASALLKTLPPDTPKYQVEPLERALVICQTTLEQMQRLWLGLSWHLESMTKNAREVEYLTRVGGPITTEDRGMLAKARMNDWARKCSQLLDQLSETPNEGEVVGVGLSSWGVTSAPNPTEPPPQPTVAVLRSGRTSPLPWPHDDLGSLGLFSRETPGFWAGDWPSYTAGPFSNASPPVQAVVEEASVLWPTSRPSERSGITVPTSAAGQP